jgi:ABC-type polysaccharide/polyol phosphate transport system ATPase subunit
MSTTAIDVEKVSKTFHVPSVRRESVREHVLDLFRPRPVDQLTILDRVSFSVGQGETLGIMGRNGCGKSTLLKIISGIYQPDSGRVVARGPITPILELGVGFNPELDAIDNALLIGSVMGLPLAEIRAGIGEILAFAELERFANLKLKHYSSGMGSRLAYAIAFRAVQEILILDEIFAVGDEGFKERCKERYRDLRAAGHTVLLVSHDPGIIEDFCDRVIVLEQGRIWFEGSPAKAVAHYLDLTSHRPEPHAQPAAVAG